MAVIVYVHGFLSAPQSHKAQITKQWLAENFPHIKYYCPALSSYPEQAKNTLLACVRACDEPIYVIGSSLGGYWATYLVESGLVESAVLVNPAVAPHTRFDEFVGKPLPSYYSDEIFTLGNQDLKVLTECDRPEIAKPDNYWLMVQKADETLDYRLAVDRYRDCKQLVEEGGSHTFEGYSEWLPDIMAFFNLC